MVLPRRLRTLVCALPSAAALAIAPASASAAVTPGAALTAGYGYYGTLGLPVLHDYQLTPAAVDGPGDAVAGAISYYQGYEVLADGTVEGWGDNEYGEVGDGTEELQPVPVPIPGLSEVTAVAAGEYDGLALTAKGTVYSWGYSGKGELGRKAEGTNNLTATPIPGLSGITDISAGCYTGFAVASSGQLYAWGYNGYGELGLGNTSEADTPTPVPGMTEAVEVSAGCYHTLVRMRDGAVYAMGDNVAGDVNGSKTTEDVKTPALVPVSEAAQVAAGYQFSSVLLKNGTVEDWGSNEYHELGDGTNTEETAPKAVAGLSGVTSIEVGGYYVLALRSDGTMVGWGYADYGELGIGKTEEVPAPVVLPYTHVTALAQGNGNSDSSLVLSSIAEAGASTSSLAFGGQIIGSSGGAQTVTVTNRGPAQLSVTGDSLAGAGAAAFVKTSDGCAGATLAVGATCAIGVRFAPAIVGAASASLTISSSSNTAIPAVALSGEGRPHVPPVLSSLLLTSTAFPAAHSGASAVSAAATGTYLIYSDSQAGTATFTVLQKTAGVYHGSGSSRACGRAPQHRSRTARRCTYESALGSFTHADAAGTNALRFTGRVKGRTLAAGAYTLSAVATSGEGSSSARTAAFKITR